MAAILRLEDGRALYRSSVGYCGMLELIAGNVSSSHARLRTWLADMADRTPPFCEFDMRGLTASDRQEFWSAAERALAGLVTRHGAESAWAKNMYAGESLAHLLRMHRSILSGEPPALLNDLDETIEFSGVVEDLDHLWSAS